MKRILFLALILAGCTPYQQTISSYDKIDANAKTIAMDSVGSADIHQDFKQVFADAGFKIYNRDSERYAARYEFIEEIQKDDNVRCGLWEDGYTYELMFKDNIKKKEVFSMKGQGCRETVLNDFTSLVNNQYGEKKETTETPKDADAMQAPVLRSDGRTWWAN